MVIPQKSIDPKSGSTRVHGRLNAVPQPSSYAKAKRYAAVVLAAKKMASVRKSRRFGVLGGRWCWCVLSHFASDREPILQDL